MFKSHSIKSNHRILSKTWSGYLWSTCFEPYYSTTVAEMCTSPV